MTTDPDERLRQELARQREIDAFNASEEGRAIAKREFELRVNEVVEKLRLADWPGGIPMVVSDGEGQPIDRVGWQVHRQSFQIHVSTGYDRYVARVTYLHFDGSFSTAEDGLNHVRVPHTAGEVFGKGGPHVDRILEGLSSLEKSLDL